MKAQIVVGLGFGDEGKGVATDFLCSIHPNSLVVRFSGGQQAGHNVVLNGKSHIHSSFGSGTLRGFPSYISEYCTFSPTTLINEYKILREKGLSPKIYIHPKAHLTTSFEIKQSQEFTNIQNGTCGLGVGATMKRNLTTPYKLYAVDLLEFGILESKMGIMYENHIFLEDSIPNYDEFMNLVDKGVIEITTLHEIQHNFNNIIFEGSQGILLDMDHGIFPHVTYANTTSKNALEICKDLGISDKNIEIFYTMRGYCTRHGNGPKMFLPAVLNLKNTEYEINRFNNFQKEFKTGHWDFDILKYSFKVDSIYSSHLKDYQKNIIVSCLDQLDSNTIDYIKNGINHIKGDKTIYKNISPESKTIRKWTF